MNTPQPERWRRIQDLFEAALEQPPEQWRAFVAARCGGDADLALEVLSLLAADAAAPDYLDDLAAGLADLAADADGGGRDRGEGEPGRDALLGTELGAYTVESLLATGGMGSVYLAHRSDGAYDEKVALKVIRRGMDSEQVVARFRTERQILARLRHPHIANLLDGGLTADGRPFLVMEYVEGRPIDVYCRDENLDLGARLELLRTVCEAVQHAHANLVVHRDLKPANILVTDDGKVKLMDFGIAKLVHGEDDDPVGDAPVTMPGLQVLTPGYAAPEQIRGEPVTTATDVFGLGIVMYELLTGARPFGGREATAAELAKATCEGSPPRPSRATDPAAGGAPTRRLAGDLDHICLMALRAEPARRYASPGALAEDLARFRSGEAVLAGPATLRYRAGKFARRYWRGLASTAAVLVVAVGLVAFYTGRLASERDRARLGEAKAAQVASFLSELFTQADPSMSRGAEITAREILERGAERVRTDLAGQPDVQSAMLDVLGDVHTGLGLYAEGRELLGRSLAIKRELHGDAHLESARSAALLGRLEAQTGRYDRADSLLLAALAVHRAELGPGDPQVARDLQMLALVAAHTGRDEEALRHYRDAVAIYEASGATEEVSYTVCLNDMALQMLEMGQGDEAEPLFRKTLDLQRRLLGEDHPEVANTLFNLALLLREQGDLKAAEPIQRQVLALDRLHYDDNHPNVAYSLSSMGALLRDLGRYVEAERVFAEALAIRRATLEPGHPDVIKSMGEVALAINMQGRHAEAEPRLREVLQLAREHLGEGRALAGRIDDLGWVLRDLGRYDESLALHREALAMKAATVGPEHRVTAITHMHIARSLAGAGDLEAALAAQRRAFAIADAAVGDSASDPFAAVCELTLAGILRELGRLDEAAAHAGRALETLRRQVDPESNRLAGALHGHGRVLQDRGDLAGAERDLRRALAIRQAVLGHDHPSTAWTAACLADVLLARGLKAEAAALAQPAERVLAQRLPAGHRRLAHASEVAARTGS